MEAAPPSYTDAGLPDYSQNAQPNEHSIVINASQSTSQPALEEYQYKNGRLVLNLGPKHPRLFRPAYGWNGLVEGYVQVKKKTTNVQSIVVTIQGEVTTGLTERGFLTDQTRTIVLRTSQTLFDDSSGEQFPINGEHYTFSLPLPSYVAGGTDPLPPTFSVMSTGLAADVTYFIKVEMIRKGKLRQNERQE